MSVSTVVLIGTFFVSLRFPPAKQVEINIFYAGSPCKKGVLTMIKTVVTEAIISKGYEGADAIKIIQGEKGDIARFRIGTKVYDPKADPSPRSVLIK